LLRFLFGGLATVAGLVLLFVASFGDPALVHRMGAALSSIVPGQAPAATEAPVETADRAPPPSAASGRRAGLPIFAGASAHGTGPEPGRIATEPAFVIPSANAGRTGSGCTVVASAR
jgi:hypothetical protein